MDINKLVEMQRQFSKLYRTTPVIDINKTSIMIAGLDNLRELMPDTADCKLITIKREDLDYPFETYFMYEGIRFFTIYKDPEEKSNESQ